MEILSLGKLFHLTLQVEGQVLLSTAECNASVFF